MRRRVQNLAVITLTWAWKKAQGKLFTETMKPLFKMEFYHTTNAVWVNNHFDAFQRTNPIIDCIQTRSYNRRISG